MFPHIHHKGAQVQFVLTIELKRRNRQISQDLFDGEISSISGLTVGMTGRATLGRQEAMN
jgi:hypothetical protein